MSLKSAQSVRCNRHNPTVITDIRGDRIVSAVYDAIKVVVTKHPQFEHDTAVCLGSVFAAFGPARQKNTPVNLSFF